MRREHVWPATMCSGNVPPAPHSSQRLCTKRRLLGASGHASGDASQIRVVTAVVCGCPRIILKSSSNHPSRDASGKAFPPLLVWLLTSVDVLLIIRIRIFILIRKRRLCDPSPIEGAVCSSTATGPQPPLTCSHCPGHQSGASRERA